jgi:hypothetical protein
MKNSQLAHIWAQQNKNCGKTGNMFFEGATIYSYGYHFPIAHFTDKNFKGKQVVLYNSSDYSSTTARHKSYTLSAIDRSSCCIFNVDTELLKTLRGNNTSGYAFLSYEKRCIKSVNDNLKEIATFRKIEKKQNALNYCGNQLAELKNLFEIYGYKISEETEKLIADLQQNSENLLSQFSEVIKKERAKRLQWEKETEKRESEKLQEILPTWRNCEENNNYPNDLYFLRNAKKIFLRIVGENVETSKGAVFPVKHAIEAYDTVKKGIAGSKLGHFTIQKVDKKGVKAGCHFVEFEEIEKIATQLGISHA